MKQTPDNNNALILIVDDSVESVSMLNSILEQEGMSTLVALEGNQALNIASRMLPDLILLDAVMPNIDGFEVCKKLKENPDLKNIPVIFMTGLKDTDDIVKGLDVGGVDYITKPINNDELIARMRVHLANARLTLSAQSALDTAGQHVFSVNAEGKILWSTPQVNQLLEKAYPDNKASDALSQEIKQWFSHTPSVGMNLSLNSPFHSLKVALFAINNVDNFLLRLIDNEHKNESHVLKTAFSITTREAEVLLWIVRGKTNRDIGQILGTSPRTINKHLEQVYKKLNVENRTAAATKALPLLTR